MTGRPKFLTFTVKDTGRKVIVAVGAILRAVDVRNITNGERATALYLLGDAAPTLVKEDIDTVDVWLAREVTS